MASDATALRFVHESVDRHRTKCCITRTITRRQLQSAFFGSKCARFPLLLAFSLHFWFEYSTIHSLQTVNCRPWNGISVWPLLHIRVIFKPACATFENHLESYHLRLYHLHSFWLLHNKGILNCLPPSAHTHCIWCTYASYVYWPVKYKYSLACFGLAAIFTHPTANNRRSSIWILQGPPWGKKRQLITIAVHSTIHTEVSGLRTICQYSHTSTSQSHSYWL